MDFADPDMDALGRHNVNLYLIREKEIWKIAMDTNVVLT